MDLKHTFSTPSKKAKKSAKWTEHFILKNNVTNGQIGL
jgi:hypothetical protein